MENEFAFGWDSAIAVTRARVEKLLAVGPAKFTVVSFVRGRHAGSDKLPACPRAELLLECEDVEGDIGDVSVKLPLHEKTLFKLVQFAKSTGLVDADLAEGESFKMPWDEVLGASGVCEINHRTWKGDDGIEHTSNNVVRFIYGDEARDIFTDRE